MAAAKKTQMETIGVAALSAVFLVVLVTGPLKPVLFGRRSSGPHPAAPAPSRAPAPGHPAAAAPPAAATPAQPQEPAAYQAANVRDPLRSQLPSLQPKTPQVSSASAAPLAPPSPPRPTLQVQGVVWGGSTPRAIIDGEVYHVGDIVQGCRIVAIDSTGVTVDFGGLAVVYRPAAAPMTQTAGSLSQQSHH